MQQQQQWTVSQSFMEMAISLCKYVMTVCQSMSRGAFAWAFFIIRMAVGKTNESPELGLNLDKGMEGRLWFLLRWTYYLFMKLAILDGLERLIILINK